MVSVHFSLRGLPLGRGARSMFNRLAIASSQSGAPNGRPLRNVARTVANSASLCAAQTLGGKWCQFIFPCGENGVSSGGKMVSVHFSLRGKWCQFRMPRGENGVSSFFLAGPASCGGKWCQFIFPCGACLLDGVPDRCSIAWPSLLPNPEPRTADRFVTWPALSPTRPRSARHRPWLAIAFGAPPLSVPALPIRGRDSTDRHRAPGRGRGSSTIDNRRGPRPSWLGAG